MTTPLVSCRSCKNWSQVGRTCRAYPEPEEIPIEIWIGEHDHRTSFEGDNGILYEPAFEKPTLPAGES